MKYVNVVVDNKSNFTDTYYTYKSEFDDISVGSVVSIPFGKGNREKIGFVIEIFESYKEALKSKKNNLQKESDFLDIDIKKISYIYEDWTLSRETIKTALWIRDRFFCRYIEAISLFLPWSKIPSEKSMIKIKQEITNKALDRSIDESSKNLLDDVSNSYSFSDKSNLKKSRLTEKQIEIYQKILEIDEVDERKNSKIKPLLIKGVTSSGKTEIYIEVAKKNSEENKNTLVMFPELTLTNNIVSRFKTLIPKEKIAVFHSKMTSREKLKIWLEVKLGFKNVVIGTRSSLFLPFETLDTVIIDEEHSKSYKSSQTPKYNTVDIAIKRCSSLGANLVVSSATPSMQSLKRVEDGFYEKVELLDRFNKKPLPAIDIVDMRLELREGNKSIFSRKLYDEILTTKQKKLQTLLIVNKKGYSFVSCRECGFVLKCPTCQIPLTLFKEKSKMSCSYCNYIESAISKCPNCESKYIKSFGIGGERVLEEVQKFFPAIKAELIDTSKDNFKEVDRKIKLFQKGKIDLLIGTEILSKGLEFESLRLVGIIAGDTAFNSNDYLGGEEALQLIIHSGGRSGRNKYEGKVILQTYKPDFYPIKYAVANDIESFYKLEKKYRKKLFYPPFGYLIQLDIIGKDKSKIIKKHNRILRELKNGFANISILKERFKEKEEKGNYRMISLIKLDVESLREFNRYALMWKKDENLSRDETNLIIDINPNNIWRI